MVATIAALDFLLQCCKISFGVRRIKDVDFVPVKARLQHYALMLEGSSKAHALPRAGLFLNNSEHKILLGVIKKIETKNAVLSAINVFLAVTLLRALVDFKAANGGPLLFYATLTASTAAIFLLVARLDGISHLSQFQSSRLISKSPSNAAAKMQESLMINLLQKESIFAMSMYVVVAIAAVPLIAAVIAAVKRVG